MARRKKDEKQLDGTIDVKTAVDALVDIEGEYGIPTDQSLEILGESFARAYKILANQDNPENADDMRVMTDIDIDKGTLIMYEVKDVVASDDDIEDDFLQMALDDAKEIDPDIKAGEQVHLPIDLNVLDESFHAKAHSLFLQKMRERSKASIKNLYLDQIGTIITGVVDNVEREDGALRSVKVSFGKANGILRRQDLMRNDDIVIGQTIKCYLKGVDEKRKNEILLISRSDSQFLGCIFKDLIDEVANGLVKINGIARDAGIRAKVAVSGTNPDVDPAGACIGPDGIRINSIRDLVNGERIDIVHYQENLQLYIAEALHPATVIGIAMIEGEERRRCVAIVKNGEKKEAIGKTGVNVRLASRLVGLSIDILEMDEAMATNLRYTSLDEIRRDLALNRVSAQEESISEDETESILQEDSGDEFVDNFSGALNIDDHPVEKAVEKTPVAEKPVSPVAIPDEHIEIKTRSPRISLAELEAQIEEEKKAGKNKPTDSRSYHKRRDDDVKAKEEKLEEEDNSEKKPTTALPIYTEDELKEIESEEEEGEDDDSNYEDYDEEYGNY